MLYESNVINEKCLGDNQEDAETLCDWVRHGEKGGSVLEWPFVRI